MTGMTITCPYWNGLEFELTPTQHRWKITTAPLSMEREYSFRKYFGRQCILRGQKKGGPLRAWLNMF